MWISLFAALMGAVVGGLLSVIGIILVERYRRALDSAAVTSALTAEIKATISIVESRAYLGEVERILAEFHDDKRRKATLSIQTPDDPFPIFHAMRDKLGLLPSSIIADVVRFYMLMNSAIIDVRPGGLLADNECDEAAFARLRDLSM